MEDSKINKARMILEIIKYIVAVLLGALGGSTVASCM